MSIRLSPSPDKFLEYQIQFWNVVKEEYEAHATYTINMGDLMEQIPIETHIKSHFKNMRKIFGDNLNHRHRIRVRKIEITTEYTDEDGLQWAKDEDPDDPLFGLEAEKQRADQLGKNCNWLIQNIDIIHANLCPEQNGSWQDKVKQATTAAVKAKILLSGTKKIQCSNCKLINDIEWINNKCPRCGHGEEWKGYWMIYKGKK